ncbi:MAG TPA: hypothetical protein IAA69_01020 [Candidatus Aveggerthella stercoripullorum]|uniref:Uncharacterized protein n=1 Tax=Candidatus Aveggerthella stercoripullorum TaxID=2840688 RepID=A0A9D1A0W9_9ACTN|nr:hypothetical protein [Candidatus Aveggerthella stercoripullorum]
MGRYINRFARRGFWKRLFKPADRDLDEAFEDGAKCAENGSVWVEDGQIKGPGLDRFFHQQEVNAARVIDDIEEDCAPLLQELSKPFATYQGFLCRFAEADRRYKDAMGRHETAGDARSRNQARYDMDRAKAERDKLFDKLQEVREYAEDNGLSDLRAIQAKRLTEAEEHRAHMDHLMSYFLRGAASVLGSDTVHSTQQASTWTDNIIEGYIKLLEGGVNDGRWNMNFAQHLEGAAA